MNDGPPFQLPPGVPHLPDTRRRRLETDYERFRDGLPADLHAYCLEAYGVDIAGQYAGFRISNPFGKASGQLSLNVRQVRRDSEAGLGFVVLKTVIAEDEQGEQRMSEWAIRETRMQVEAILGAEGSPGWTVTWKGRGWHESFESYCRFFGDALEAAGEVGMVVAPSVKYHLPPPDESRFAEGEYRHTTGRLLDVWRARCSGPMPLEKDFSPTLAGDDRSREQEQILYWLRNVPQLIFSAAEHASSSRQSSPGSSEPSLTLGVKLMNARSDVDFQVAMCRALMDDTPRPPDYLVYANRLYDPERQFEGKVGVAYGGPDLSRRNLAALRRVLAAAHSGSIRRPVPPISGTGNILTGKVAIEYGLLGATSCQLHTLFQLPDREFGATMRSKSAAALHHLLLHPHTGCVVWLLHLAQERGCGVGWLDLPALGRERIITKTGENDVPAA